MTGFANDLRFCREAAGLSLSAAAKAAGITKAHLHDMESGRARNPGVSTLAGLARAYGQNVGWMAERAALSLSSEVQPVGSERSDDERSASTAPIPSPETPESGGGWLIEAWDSNADAFGAKWWALGLDNEDGCGWTTDSLKALRFARACDAQAYIDDIGWTEAKPTEHGWG